MIHNKILIGLSGKKGSGKTTVAHALIDRCMRNCVRMAFGDAVKEEISDVYHIPLEQMYDIQMKNRLIFRSDFISSQDSFITRLKYRVIGTRLFPHHSMRIRDIMQWYGTDICRAQDDSYWIKKFDFKYQESDADVIIVDDVRFINEAMYIIDNGGFLIRLDSYSASLDVHTSECELDDFTRFDMRIQQIDGDRDAPISRICDEVVPYIWG